MTEKLVIEKKHPLYAVQQLAELLLGENPTVEELREARNVSELLLTYLNQMC